MTNITPAGTAVASKYATHKLTFLNVVRAEALKIRTLKSNWVLIIFIVSMMILLALAGAGLINTLGAVASTQQEVNDPTFAASQKATWVTMAHALGITGLDLANLFVAAFAVVLITNEYATHQITSTLSVVPKRTYAYFGKWTLLSVVSFLIGVVSVSASYLLASQLLDSSIKQEVSVDASQVRVWLLAGVCFMFISWIGYGIGALVRNSAGAITCATALLFVLPIIVAIFTNLNSKISAALNYMPATLARTMLTHTQAPDAAVSITAATVWLGLIGIAFVALGYWRFAASSAR